MNQQLAGLNLDIVAATKKPATSTINLDFFSGAGIIEGEIKLASGPVNSKNFSRIELEENIVIVGEGNRVVFSEAMAGKTPDQLKIPVIASKYIQMLSNLEYEAIGVNIRGFLSFPEGKDAASRYIASNFLANASWQTIGFSPVRASINLVFDRERSPFYLNIAEAAMRKEEDEATVPIVMFSGSFSYVVNGESAAEKIAYMHEIIANWQTDFTAFNEIINNHFLAQNTAVNYQEMPQMSSYQEMPQIEAYQEMSQTESESETNLFVMNGVS
ncbi:hypothetical protein OGM63_26865 [Plectonema radiosum NIES-515]|uniref:Uncharacterized protein n=1 Tax=Plectonema radiosum NIES-515 TaxID=2986073 RepID=A0ABT3B6T6_9CYAN|nr:hypothetical protein [Plectonema radiosum]MCV3217087.1 hypothetical protein [Plectonema radiosum NIES-515]